MQPLSLKINMQVKCAHKDAVNMADCVSQGKPSNAAITNDPPNRKGLEITKVCFSLI